jgi:large repetitive protein
MNNIRTLLLLLAFFSTFVFANANITPSLSNTNSEMPCTVVGTVMSTTQVSCPGNCDGIAVIAASGGTMPYVASGSFGTITFTSVGTITGLCAGTNTVLITDALGCPFTLLVTITAPPIISFSASTTPDGGTCNGSISVTATGGTGVLTYSNNGGLSFQASPTFAGLCAGTYNVCVMDANGCVQCLNYTVASSCTMVATIFSPTPVTCFGLCDGSATVMATAGTPPYIVTGPGPAVTFTSTTTVTGLCGGANTLLVTDAVGCTYPLTIFVSSPTAIVVTESHVNPSSGVSSDGSITLNASGGTPGYQYSVGGGPYQVSGFFPGLPCGTYICQVMDMNGCIGTVTVSLSCGCSMVATVFGMTDVLCYGDCNGTTQIAATLGIPPYVVSGTGITTTTFTSSTTLTGLCAGSYTAIVTDAAGCSYTLTFIINSPTALSIGATVTPATSGCNGSITTSSSGGTSPYTWSIDGGVTWGIPSSFNSLCAGTYSVCVMDANGCIACTTVVVSSSGCLLTSGVISSTPASCNGVCDGVAVITTAGGTMPYTAIIGSATFTYTSVLTAINLCAGPNIAFITDAVGCTSTFTFIITEPTPIVTTIFMGSNPSSFGSCDGTINGAANGGTPGYTYEWINCSTGLSTGITSAPPASGFCAGTYAFIATDANGCSDTSGCLTLTNPTSIVDNTNAFEFNVYPNPTNGIITVSLEGNQDACMLLLTNVLGKTIGTYSIRNKLTIDMNASQLSEGVYFITITGENGIRKTQKLVFNR